MGKRYAVCVGELCERSIHHLSVDQLRGWYSNQMVPGGKGGRSQVPSEYSQFFQVVQNGPSHCTKCGAPLVDEPRSVALGRCTQCERIYGSEDFGRNFCPCGTPIAIPEDVVKRYKEDERLSEILSLIQSMQQNGFFP